jgi:hypothetical protein
MVSVVDDIFWGVIRMLPIFFSRRKKGKFVADNWHRKKARGR